MSTLRSVLRRTAQSNREVTFSQPNDDDDPRFVPRSMSMSYQDWDELDRPSEITIIIEAGDQLNDE